MVQDTVDMKYIWSSSIKDGLVWFDSKRCKGQCIVIFSDIGKHNLAGSGRKSHSALKGDNGCAAKTSVKGDV
jgi:hypothetical protein